MTHLNKPIRQAKPKSCSSMNIVAMILNLSIKNLLSNT